MKLKDYYVSFIPALTVAIALGILVLAYAPHLFWTYEAGVAIGYVIWPIFHYYNDGWGK